MTDIFNQLEVLCDIDIHANSGFENRKLVCRLEIVFEKLTFSLSLCKRHASHVSFCFPDFP
jgi:hypothetical protein